MIAFIIYAMCPKCMVMFGPFTSDVQRNRFFDSAHKTLCSSRAATAVIVDRTYSRGDASRPFGSSFAGTCYHCNLGYVVGDSIRMITVQDGEKGKAVHDDPCSTELLERLNEPPDQSDEPPF